MEVKKTRRADLEKGKSRWLFMGLIVTLSFMFVSFEWTERNVTYTISDLVSDPDFFEELVPVTYNQDKPLLPPPPPAAVNPEELNIVDNQLDGNRNRYCRFGPYGCSCYHTDSLLKYPKK